jgi:pimeloyl-ACP methyl ester carboxylesterase/DNA-binding winged helix-turn-helix (wHTH) protein
MSPRIFRFGDFELDRNAYELRREGRPLKLERIPLDLLFLLVDRRDQLVTREEIQERIWGKGIFLDTDNAINSAVRKIRRALHDDPDAPRFVVTVPTKGYRFIAAIREPSAQPSHSAEANVDDAVLSTAASVKYARSGDVHIAYRVFGDGPRDIVLIPGTLSHAELSWERPHARHLLNRLTRFARVIVFDKRGQGLSDRNVAAEQTVEERIIDISAVMDAAGSARATLYGWSEGGPAALVFSATYPQRTTALVLYGTFASLKDPPWSITREVWESYVTSWETHWGEGILLELNAPSVWGDQAVREETGRWERATASPGSIGALMRLNYDLDVRHALPVIQAPTLVLHRVGDTLVPSDCSRYLAENIPGARFVGMPGTDHSIFDNETQDFVADQIAEFVAGAPHRPEPDRVLTTVMFIYIEESRPLEAQIGEQRWRELLKSSYELLRAELAAFHGRELKMTGNGLMATFDGPARAIKFACSAREKVRALGLQLRTGLHTGECELIGSDVRGVAVDIAAWVTSLANPDEVLLSSTVKDLVAGSNLQFADRGMHTFEAVRGEWRLFRARI